jgi:hypothetical protein
MHLVKNNVVLLVLGALVIAGKISIKEVTTHLLWSMPRHLSQGGATTRILCMQAMSPIQGKQPRRIRGRHVDVTWIEGPTGRQTASKPSGHRGPTLGPTAQPPRESTGRSGPTMGRPTPQVGRTDLVSAHPSLPRGVSWLAPCPLPGCSRHSHEVVQGL